MYGRTAFVLVGTLPLHRLERLLEYWRMSRKDRLMHAKNVGLGCQGYIAIGVPKDRVTLVVLQS